MTESDPTLKAAIIGTGRIGDTYDAEMLHYPDIELPGENVHAGTYSVEPKAHAPAYRSMDEYELIAGANRGVERLQEFGRRHDLEAVYTDYQEMLEETDPDVVSVCTQSPEKCAAVVACADHGVDAIIVEKAMATSLSEADRMIDACNRAGSILAMGHPMRFSPMFRHVKETLNQGAIGTFAHLSTHTGSLVHGASHDFDYLRFLGGGIRSVRARIPELEPDHRVDDPLTGEYPDLSGDAMITMRNGATAFVSDTSGATRGMIVRGSDGFLTVPRSTGLLKQFERKQADPATFDYPGEGGRDVSWEQESNVGADVNDLDTSATVKMLSELYQTIVGNEPFVSTGEDGRAALEAGIACYHSALTDSTVQLPLDRDDLRVINR